MKHVIRLTLLTLALAIASGEIVLRLIPRSLVPRLRVVDRVYTARRAWTDMMTGDPSLGYKMKPGLDLQFPSELENIPFRTVDLGLGEIGFRDLGLAPPYRIVAIGGSFAVCDDVRAEACWVRRVGDETGRSAATLGVNGYSTIAAARMLAGYGERLRPEIVLVEVHPNDLRDNLNYERWAASGEDDLWAWLAKSHGRSAADRWLGDRSMVYRLADSAMRGPERRLITYRRDQVDLVFRFDQWFTAVVTEGATHAGWAPTQRSLIEIRDTAAAAGAEVMAVLFPTKEQVYWDAIADQAPPPMVGKQDGPIEMAGEFCRRSQIPVCDLRQALRQAAQGKSAVFHRISAHMNEQGNAVAARAIVACLESNQLIPPVSGRKFDGVVDGH